VTRPARIARNIAIGAVGFIILLAIVALIIIQTAWFRNTVREKIIAATEQATGGRVEVGAFGFDVSHLRATVTNFVIHGKEPANAAPFVRVDRLEVDVRLFTSLKHLVDIAYLGIQRPQVSVLVFPDGTTSIPSPKESGTSNKSPLATVVDLAIGRFDLANGLLDFNDHKQELNVRASNVRALLNWNIVQQRYEGEIAMEPLYVLSGRNTPVNFKVTVPVVLERDRIDVKNASVTTPQSKLQINASVRNMKDPVTSAQINGQIALADLKNVANLPLILNAKNVPTALDLEANVTEGHNTIEVKGLRASLGESTIEASGTLQDPNGKGALSFKSDLSLAELGRLANVSMQPSGDVRLNGTAKLDANYAYQADGNIEARNVSLNQPGQHIRNLNLESAVHVDPHHVSLKGMRLTALGGELTGNADLEDFSRYHADANVRNLDLQQIVRQLAPKQNIPYDGIASGTINVTGDTKTPGTKSLVATAKLNIAPGRHGIPMSGHVDVDYRGANDAIVVRNSSINLPHTQLKLDGSVGRRLDVHLNTTDLNDLLAAANLSGTKVPVQLVRGQASFNGSMTGSLSAPRLTGHLSVDRFAVEGRQFNTLQADLTASPSQATVTNGLLTRAAMQTSFSAQVGLHDWSPTPNQRVNADVSLRNGDVADLMALAGQPSAGYSGTLSADAHITGTVGNPLGTATIQAANGTLDTQPFDTARANITLADQLVTVPAAYLTSGSSRIDLSADFQHPRDSFSTGRIHAHARTNQVDLATIRPLQQSQPDTAGLAQMDVDVTGQLAKEFLLTAVNADAAVKGLRYEHQNFGDLTATARTNGQNVAYHVNSDFSGSTIRVSGNTQLTTDYPTTADATIQNLPIVPVLALAKQTGTATGGVLSGTAHFTGTMKNPQGSANFDLANAVIEDERFEHIRARATYASDAIDVPQLDITSGPSRITLTAHYDHPPDNLQSGKLQFRLGQSHIDLARLRNVQKLRPGVAGQVILSADGAATVQAAEPRVLLTRVNANIAATGLVAQGKQLGSLNLNANTTGSDRVHFTLASSLAGASLNGSGDAQLRGDYPINARISFQNVTYQGLAPLLSATAPTTPPSFDAGVDGEVTAAGPVMKTDQLQAELNISKLSVRTIPVPGSTAKPVAIQNDGPIVASLNKGTVRVQSARVTGPGTRIQATGTASITGGPMNVSVNGNADLTMLQNFDPDIDSSTGSVVLATTVRGTMTKPLINGTLRLQNAGLHYAGISNGLNHANGTIVFNGNSATIRDLSAESGGGNITASGFVGYADRLRFGLRANARRVRILTPQEVTILIDTDVQLTGTSDRSLISGTATIQGITYRPQSDIGSMLTRAAPPVQAPSSPSPVLDNMRLDIRVRTSPALMVQASLAQNLQLDANLRVRGTASQPGILGRVNISEGQLVFFGSSYNVNAGTIAFYNPVRIEPVLDISLETQAKGVEVVLHVTGPIDNMKLSYTSDPPLQFQEIVSLLAAGKTPTSDPTLLANQPATPQQSFQQMGESALVSKAIADPVASRLQRVFGVSQLKIDPTFTSGSQVPQARLTLQQQITSNITFTYISALNDPNTTIVRMEWAFNPKWSAVATRDENGIFSVNLFYKKQFR